jgi:hypothetical protein
MIRNISVLFLISIVFCSSNISADQDIKAEQNSITKTFDQAAFDKVTEILHLKKQLSKHRENCFLGEYQHEELGDEQQYLKKNKEKLLTRYKVLSTHAKKEYRQNLIASGGGLIATLACIAIGNTDTIIGNVVAIFGSGISAAYGISNAINAHENYNYLNRNPLADTEEQQKEALIKMLDRKLIKLQNKIEKIKKACNKKH